MKTLTFFTLLAASHTLWGQTNIQLHVDDITDSVGYLGYHFADKRYVLDTVDVAGPDISFSKATFNPGLYFFYTPNVYFEFIVNESQIELKTTGLDYSGNLEVITSAENELFYAMQRFIKEERTKYAALDNELKQTEDSLEINRIQKKMRAVDEEVTNYQQNLVDQHPDTFIAKMVRCMLRPEMPEDLLGEGDGMEQKRYAYYKDHFFEGLRMDDGDLLRTPVFHPKVTEYLDKVIFQDPDSVIKEVDKLINESKSNEETYRYFLVTLSNKYESSPIMGQDEVFVHIVETYYLNGSATWVSDDLLQKLQERIATIKPNFIGNQAPNLVLTDTLSTPVSLYAIEADYTVLYFYDPDCGHCKTKTPLLYESYGRMQNSNVEVLAINITTNTERWKEYIQENDLQWYNLMDESGISNFRYYYDVRSTPTVFILDRDKTIIAKKIDAEQVETFIEGYSRRQGL